MKMWKRGLSIICAAAVALGVVLAMPMHDVNAAGSVYVLVQAKSGMGTISYSYNGDGLLKQKDRTGDGDEHISYVYDKKDHLKEKVYRTGAEEAHYNFTYDKKGHRTQMTSNPYGTTIVNYVNDKKGRLVQENWSVNSILNWMAGTYTFNDKGLIASYSEKYADGYSDSVQILFYDGRKNLKKVEYGNRSIGYTNHYKNGRLMSRVDTDGVVTTYKYKKIYVDGMLQSRVKAQQWRLLNDKVPGELE